jgi:hypothetical protein
MLAVVVPSVEVLKLTDNFLYNKTLSLNIIIKRGVIMNKKASLSLSITAIVVIVIAFVVLGLGLSLTRLIFKGAEEKLPGAFDLTELEKEPKADNPITISDRVEIGRGKSEELKIGYYNTNADSHSNVILKITGCTASSPEAQAVISDDTLPLLTSIPQNVPASGAVAYKVILTERGLLGGSNYICTIAALTEGNPPWQTKQFFLYVTA